MSRSLKMLSFIKVSNTIRNSIFTFALLMFSAYGFAQEATAKEDVNVVMGRIQGILKHPGSESRPLGSSPQKYVLSNTKIYIFKGTLKAQKNEAGEEIPGTLNKENAKALQVIETDNAGNFRAYLPPGTYTLFYEKDGALLHTDGLLPLDRTYQNWSSFQINESVATDYNVITQRRPSTASELGSVIIGTVR